MKIITFDFDMTLVDHTDWKIPPSALKAIDILHKNHKIVIATGRNMRLKESEEYLERIRPDAVAHLNGAMVEVEGNYIFKSPLDSICLGQFIQRAEEMDWTAGTVIDNRFYCLNPKRMEEREIELMGRSSRVFDDIHEILGRELYSLATMEDGDAIAQMEKEFPMFRFPRFSSNFGADVVSKNVSKEIGMEKLLKHWNMSFEDVIAFGDSPNDLELIQAAAIGVAMGNANAIIKKHADYITSDINNDGIWKACEYFDFFK